MRIYMYIIIILSFLSTSVSAQNLDSIFLVLDKEISLSPKYTEEKQTYLNNLSQNINTNTNVSLTEKYQLYKNLANEYEFFLSDSAYYYADKTIEIATILKNEEWINDEKIRLARILSNIGVFYKSNDILNSINIVELTQQQKKQYYSSFFDLYIYWVEFQNVYDSEYLQEKLKNYQDSILSFCTASDLEYVFAMSKKNIENNRYEQAYEVLHNYLLQTKPYTRDYAVITSMLSYLYEKNGNTDKQKEYLTLSALSDIRSSIKENVSLRTLAILLYNDGDIERANNYIKKSLDDANFYNSKLRNSQIASLFPIISQSYQSKKNKQQEELKYLLITVSILSLILVFLVLYLFKQKKKVSKANERVEEINSRLNDLNTLLKEINLKQTETNVSLTEANNIKEQFIASFLEICTKSIEELNSFKLMVYRKIKSGQINDLLQITSKSQLIQSEQKELYINFDKAFLNIYPNFIEKTNELLREEEQYIVEEPESLNNELRVLALIRLGIKDSNKIATFLDYNIRTIYNYRSKIKSKTKNMDEDIENAIRKIH